MRMAKLFVFLGMVVLLVGLAQAAGLGNCTIVSPASSATISGVQHFVITYQNNETMNVTNCTATFNSVVTVNITPMAYGAGGNASFDISTYGASDTDTYATTATCKNETSGSGIWTCTGLTGLIPDNTNPEVSITTPIDKSENVQGFIATVSCKNSTSATLWLDGLSWPMTVSGSNNAESCTYDFGDTSPPEKAYKQVYVIALDLSSDSTTSAPFGWIVQNAKKAIGGIAGQVYVQQQQQEQQEQQAIQDTKKSNLLTVVIVIIIIMGIGYFLLGIGKKK